MGFLDDSTTHQWKSKKGSENEDPNKKQTSLIDPRFEYIDPTPDVHAMFSQFNSRFFWGKLHAVEVRWCPRETKSAGVCYYENGLCFIELSAPLLILRPRKDLVETLLHEMIHAYLLVTNNDHGRSEHGPEFHKHMRRINKEAGTKITVYHDFHDEVRFYQLHWWRCNGPCQKWRPYFGMVKRKTNHAPGPTDFWWAAHQAKCGGTYIKVHEPHDYSEKKTGYAPIKGNATSSNEKNDIHNFFPFMGEAKVLATSSSHDKSETILNGKDSSGKGAVQNTGAVTSNKRKADDIVPQSPVAVSSFFTKIGSIMKDSIESMQSPLKKLKNSPFIETFFTKSPDTPCHNKIHSSKGPDNQAQSSANDSLEVMASCPSCGTLMEEHAIKSHLDICLLQVEKEIPLSQNFAICPICSKECSLNEINCHIDVCMSNSDDSIPATAEEEDDMINCPMCGKKLLKCALDFHLDSCILCITKDEAGFIGEDGDSEVNDASEREYGEDLHPCPVCLKLVKENLMNNHLDECLSADILKEITQE